jgi:antitoxin component YwqK of YwqJK toxin-antitoxin module
MFFSPKTKRILQIPNTTTHEVFDRRGYIEYIGSLSEANQPCGYGTEYYKSGYKQDRRPYKKGPFSNGHLSGDKCSEFTYEGALLYSGSYLNGLRHGQGTSFNPNVSIQFSGEWIYGVPQGTITVTREPCLKLTDFPTKFEGSISNGKKEGFGKDYFQNRAIKFVGEFVGGFYHGPDCKIFNIDGQQVYIGTMKKGKRHGPGIEYDGLGKSNFVLYHGAFYNDQKHGKDITELIPTKRGNMRFEGCKWRGVSYGVCRQFYEDGTLMYEFDFGGLKTDKMLGKISRAEGKIRMDYWPNGKLKFLGFSL